MDFKGMSRRRFLTGVGSAVTTSCLPLSAAALSGQSGRFTESREVAGSSLVVANSGYRLVIDSKTGSMVSLRSTYGVDRELLIANHAHLPLFKLEFMTDQHQFKSVTALQAKTVSVKEQSDAAGRLVTIDFKEFPDSSLDARVTIRCPFDQSLTYWNLELTNHTTSWIANVQFPVIEVPFDDLSRNESSQMLWSFLDGVLTGPVGPNMGTGNTAWTRPRRNAPAAWRTNNYPGRLTTTQLMAHYNDLGGLYVACDDAEGLPKLIDPLMEDDGVTMGIGHYPGVRGPGQVKLPYNVVVGTFHGDWYTAAEIYRDWAEKQRFCGKKLAQRSDCPAWLEKSPINITFPMRGQGDWDPPAAVNPEYTPAVNALPYLDKLAAALECPLMPTVFNWEHAGPWVQPDAFPPVGGAESMKEFMAKSREKGWYPMIYGDGVRWITAQKNTKYDGMPYFHEHGGDKSVAHGWNDAVLKSTAGWRDQYWACTGTEGGRQMILGMTRGMAELGPEIIQQFDQGCGPSACYASDHGHPPVPGPWMTTDFNRLLEEDARIAKAGNPRTTMSTEGAPPETYLPNFPIWDSRIEVSNCPLYSFLYHEHASGFQGSYAHRVSDETLRLSIARSLVTGYMLGFTLREKGLIEYDWDLLWARAIPDQATILDWAKRTNQFRAGIAKDYLIWGRMLRPYRVNNVTKQDFGWGPEPLIQSATWKAQDGRIGTVLANFTDLGETPQVELQGEGAKHLTLHTDGSRTERTIQLPAVVDIDMAPLSVCLVEIS